MAGQTLGSGADSGIKRVFATALTETNATDVEGVGVIRFEGRKIYKWVKYNNGSGDVAAIVGDCAYYYGVAGDAVTGGYEDSVVTMDRTDGYLGAGVFQSIIADGEFGWIQVEGQVGILTDVAGGIGDKMTLSDGTAGAAQLSDSETEPAIGFVAQAGAITEYSTIVLQLN